MKKELFAAIFLIAILVSCVVNIWYINDLSDNLISFVKDAERYASNESWDIAAEKAKNATELLESNDVYLNIVMPHERIDLAADSLYELQTLIDNEDTDDISGTVRITVSRFEKMVSLEKVTIESIF